MNAQILAIALLMATCYSIAQSRSHSHSLLQEQANTAAAVTETSTNPVVQCDIAKTAADLYHGHVAQSFTIAIETNEEYPTDRVHMIVQGTRTIVAWSTSRALNISVREQGARSVFDGPFTGTYKSFDGDRRDGGFTGFNGFTAPGQPQDKQIAFTCFRTR